MEREYVDSSMIRSFGFDASISTLEVEFNNSAIWQYFDVPDSVYPYIRNWQIKNCQNTMYLFNYK